MKLKKNLYHLILTITILAVFFSVWSCSSIKKTWDNANLFPVSQDIELGKQVYDEILANPSEYPIVPEKGNEQIYSYVRGIVSKLLASLTIRKCKTLLQLREDIFFSILV